MPIVVTCPKCPTKLSAPDSAAGKAVRCPKCGAAAPVPLYIPAEEVPVIEATVAPPKAKPKPVVADAGDDDDRPRKKARRDEEDADDAAPRKKKKKRYDDDDDDPPRRKRRNAGGGGSGGVIAVVVIVGLLVLGGVGVGVYFLTGKGSVFAKKTPVPAGWQQFSYPNDGFKAYFPSEPTKIGMDLQPGFGAGGPLPGGIDIPQMESMHAYTTGGFGGKDRLTVTVEVVRFRDKLPRSARDSLGGQAGGRFGGGQTQQVRWLGESATEVAFGGSLTRAVYVDKAMIVVMITGPNGGRAKPEEEAAFFDNFELTK